MKYLLEQVSQEFDDYRENVNNAWLGEYERAKEAGERFNPANVMKNMPNPSFQKFTKMFTDAQERIDIAYAKPEKPKSLFGRGKRVREDEK